ncbi:pyruvate dehydrogenase complex subunit PDH-E3I [Toxoplasma gondii TgCatPRC2]|uniref:Pyruvate dehydrogenase complex subunit PDH-E3I n=4 Tax=Toxoplasma gondii TaxID=5811 RepID=A0A125YHJ5_TOXGV|nr:pyruvate dehydrogenase complex subunit PDH-E3I [Toxoplasma gondii ME49]EPT27429.1 pyruvate dehydrogenase complex subunit PDH-E3I [Toxoplasma gondii ME49]ESS28986.1 pyruvate dehydrogenase complex subunit PDH-E3I [Toxoplasma gondii VEG]KYF44729.1 pyruvate dehydrogenase complex subunit PDH-E3I [Toxoplasma gondii ARI]KYK64625.1 pyruvate dehydrogenase complex subunit PDH-E3I [Toxoplasma gondii TgCatPRC2]|eukprot:XP_018636155.1 pyruvate dehydrogenase complex subunit PDH-E3I [Toxoplasma gondii ME49]
MFFALCLGRAVGRGFLGVSPPAWRGLFAGETFGPCLRLTALLCILTTGVITLSAAFSVQRSAVVSQTFPVPLSVSTASTQPHVAFVPSPASPFSLRASLQESPGVLTPPPHYASLSSPQPRSEGVSRLFATSSSTNFSDEPFDVTIIGLGVGGHAAALHAAALGLKTAVVSGGDPGGTCVNRGCVPSKALLAAARRVKMLRNKHHLSAMGLQVEGEIKVDPTGVGNHARGVVDKVRSGLVSSLASHGIALFDARGVMDGEPGRVVLERTAGSPASLPPFLRTKNVILAPGSLPFIPAGVTFDDAQHQVMTSDTCVSLPWLPSEICIVGSGYIGLEFMDVFTSLGSEVVMVEAGPRLLPGVDKEVAKLAERLLLQQFKERPVKLYTNTLASQVRPLGPKGEAPVEVQLTDAQTKESKGKIYPDACLIATGRRPNTEGLGLDSLGVTLKRGGFIPVDACMRVLKHAPEGDEKPEVIRGVYCVGDANGQMMLAHAASAQAVAAVETIAGRPRTVNVKHIPAACFTSPEIAFIGDTEEAAMELGAKDGFEVGKSVSHFRANTKAIAEGEGEGILKVLYRKDTGKILGCHMIGIHASDLIQECATAITNDISVKDLAFTVHTHPTLSEVVDAAWKKAVGMNAH